ncbi:DUF6233 domain-containing protein [Streptomyces albiaxialis]|uniref:DUF6233 domain-containing protein n=1 Tax=Streptomyces albiaxialis TaxID=329523 RepID=UPI0031E02D3F
MSDLPPDEPRLRILRTFLDQEATRHEVVATYLRLQLGEVDAALSAAEAARTEPFRLVPMRTPPGRAELHRADCWVPGGRPLSREDALLAREDRQVASILDLCSACRPQDLLPE